MASSSNLPVTSADATTLSRGSAARGFASSLVPLGLVALLVVVALALAALARQVTAWSGFSTEQWAAGIITILGLLGSAAAYIVSCAQALGRVKRWQAAGLAAQANGALWGLVVVALVVLLPLVLAIVIPQQPAPTLAP